MIVSCVHINEMIGCRYDFSYITYRQHMSKFKFPIVTLSNLLKCQAQYGACEAGINRNSNEIARYIRITDITEDGLLLNNLGVTANRIEDKYILNNNDLLIARSGNTVGKSYIHKSKNIGYPCFFAGYMIRFVVDETQILSDYLFVYTQLSIYKHWVKAIQRTTGQPNINAEEYGKLPIPLPAMEVQKQIVELYTQAKEAKQAKDEEAQSLLDSIDSFVLKKMGITLPAKDIYATENIVSLSQLVGNRYDPYYHNEYFEEAFKCLKETSNYRLVRLSDISILITSGITPKSGGDDYTDSEHGVAFIRSGNIDIMGEVDFDNLLYIKREVHETRMKSSKVQEGDIMIAIVGATIGQVGIYHSSREANINQAIALVRLKDGYNSEYIKEVIKSSIGQLNLDRLKRPVARANINLEEISSMFIPVPEIEIQNEIVKSIISIRKRAKLLQKEGVELLEKAKQEIEKIILG